MAHDSARSDRAGGSNVLDPNLITRRNILKGAGVFGALAAMPPVLAGCGGPSDKQLPLAGRGTNESIPQLNWALAGPMDTLDIAKTPSGWVLAVLNLSHETLVQMTSDFVLEPRLAESWKAETPTRYVYNLRSGVTFWDGSPLTAEDIVYSIERHLDPAVGSGLASLLANIKSIDTPDPGTVVIELKRPDPTFQYLPGFCPVTPKAYSVKLGKQLGASGPEVKTMGSGPYVIESYDSSRGVTLQRNKGYWGAKPQAEKVKIDIIPDANARQLALRSGAIHGTTDVPVDAVSSWKSLPSVSIGQAEPLLSAFLAFNLSKAPWNDLHLRRAVAYAVDRTGFVTSFLSGIGRESRALPSPAHWGDLADEKTVAAIYEQIPSYSFDLERAKAELAKSAHPSGVSDTIVYPSTMPAIGKAMVSLSHTLKPLGINLTVKEAPASQWRSALFTQENTISVIRLAPNYPDPMDFLNMMYNSAGAVKGNYNIAQFISPEVDDLIARQAQAPTAERVDLIAQIMKIAAEQLPYLPIWWEGSAVALKDDFVYPTYNSLFYFQQWARDIKVRA